jgi:hypothetical protein
VEKRLQYNCWPICLDLAGKSFVSVRKNEFLMWRSDHPTNGLVPLQGGIPTGKEGSQYNLLQVRVQCSVYGSLSVITGTEAFRFLHLFSISCWVYLHACLTCLVDPWEQAASRHHHWVKSQDPYSNYVCWLSQWHCLCHLVLDFSKSQQHVLLGQQVHLFCVRVSVKMQQVFYYVSLSLM